MANSFQTVTFGLQQTDSIGFTPGQQTALEISVVFSVVKEPTQQEYKNLKYPRYKGFYGYAQLMSDAYVVQEVPLNYVNQLLLHHVDRLPETAASIACELKAIAAHVASPFTPVILTVLNRNFITGIRIKLRPGTIANLGIAWETLTPQCDNQILQPDARQAKPPSPNNSSSNPADRPPDQGNVPDDNSPNDGETPSGGENPPPTPGRNLGQWFYTSRSTQLPGCTEYTGHGPVPGAVDGAVPPVWIPQTQNGPCPQAMDGIVLYGADTVLLPTGVLDLTFNFVPSV